VAEDNSSCVMCNKTTNTTIRERTEQEGMESIIKKRRLRWLGHVWRRQWRMGKDRRANQMHWLREEKEKKDCGRTGQRPL